MKHPGPLTLAEYLAQSGLPAFPPIPTPESDRAITRAELVRLIARPAAFYQPGKN